MESNSIPHALMMYVTVTSFVAAMPLGVVNVFASISKQ